MIAAHSLTDRHGVDLDVFRRYAGLSLPRHVSYPMPTWWHDVDAEFASAMYTEAIQQKPGYDLALYLHIPFCETLCKFCACNRVILRKDASGANEAVDRYMAALIAEIRRLGDTFGNHRPLRQVHWGGGSPTYLNVEQIANVQRVIREVFNLAEDAEVAMEVDPRHADREKLSGLHRAGFNRISMGVQDFDADVQRHVRRIQPFEMVREVMAAGRELGFSSINFDLIYGMPFQTVASVRRTVELSIELAPDRVAYYHYAQIPEKIATQRGMDYTRLPDSEVKLEMFLTGCELFEAAGYEFVGLDHFAKPDEALARGLQDGTTQRNFQGMTTGGGLHLLGAGVSSISHLLDVGFLQNVKDPAQYVELVEAGESPVGRGKRFTSDDRIRQTLLNQLYCRAGIIPEVLQQTFDIRFADYFARELGIMKELAADGLVTFDGNRIRATMPLGRVLLRNIAAAFDAYLDAEAYKKGEEACFSANA